MTRPTWLHAALSAMVFATAIAVGVGLPVLPRMRGVDELGFSAERAMRDLRAFSESPRPSGSPANGAAREFLAGTLRELGFLVEVQATSDGLQNVVATREGSTDSTGTLLLSAHFDTVPGSPGAADDGLGVATVLEVGRNLIADLPRRNHLVLLLTDGEEQGMRGARGFVREHPSAAAISAAIHLEATGGEGPAVLFDSGPESGHVVRAFQEVPPVADSFAGCIFAALPNNTDYAAFRERGVPGVNIATVGGSQVYHSPNDRVERVDPRSVQHLGDVTLSAARRLLQTDLNDREPPRAYRDVFGAILLVWPVAWNRWLCFFVFVLVLFVIKARLPSGDCPRGVTIAGLRWFATLLLGLVTSLVVLGWAASAGDRPFLEPRGDATWASIALGGQLLLAVAVSASSPQAARGWIGFGIAPLIVTWIGYPEAAHQIGLPMLALLTAEWIRTFFPRRFVLWERVLIGVAILLVTPLAYRVTLLAHVRAPFGLMGGAVAAAIVGSTAAPLFAEWRRGPRVALGIAGLVALTVWASLT